MITNGRHVIGGCGGWSACAAGASVPSKAKAPTESRAAPRLSRPVQFDVLKMCFIAHPLRRFRARVRRARFSFSAVRNV